MTPDRYYATLSECLDKVFDAQVKLEAAFDALATAHVAIRAAQSADHMASLLGSQGDATNAI